MSQKMTREVFHHVHLQSLPIFFFGIIQNLLHIREGWCTDFIMWEKSCPPLWGKVFMNCKLRNHLHPLPTPNPFQLKPSNMGINDYRPYWLVLLTHLKDLWLTASWSCLRTCWFSSTMQLSSLFSIRPSLSCLYQSPNRTGTNFNPQSAPGSVVNAISTFLHSVFTHL